MNLRHNSYLQIPPLGRRSLRHEDTAEPISHEEEEAERQRRRSERSTLEQLAKKNVDIVSPKLSNTELLAHYHNCLRLSAENKINHKNAFLLRLIDCMAAMVKNRNSLMDNFQVVSCTLDASAKIYAARVDRLHMDSMSVAQNLGLKLYLENETDEEKQSDDVTTPKKKIKKLKHKKGLNEDPSAYTLKTSPVVEDPTYVYMKNMFGDSQPGFISFIPNVNIISDECETAMEQTTLLFTDAPQSRGVRSTVPVQRVDAVNYKLTKSFRDILQADATELNFGDFGDSFPEDCSSECEDELLGRNVWHNVDPEGEGRSQEVAAAGDKQSSGAESTAGVSLHREAIAAADDDYSYLYLDDTLWAGPMHWKNLPVVRDRHTRKETIKQDSIFFPETCSDLKNWDISSGPRGLTLTRSFMDTMWCASRVTKPMDVHYSFRNMTKFFLRQQMRTQLGKEPYVIEENDLQESFQDDITDVAEGPSREPATSQEPPVRAGCSQETDWELVEPPMKVARIDIPFAQKAKRIDMKKLKRFMWRILTEPRRRERLEEKDGDDEIRDAAGLEGRNLQKDKAEGRSNVDSRKGVPSQGDDLSLSDSMNESMQFSELYVELLSRVPPDMEEELSEPIALQALLHLANEHTLLLTGNDVHSDITIMQDKTRPSLDV